MLNHVEPYFDAECFQAKVTVGLTALGMLQADEDCLPLWKLIKSVRLRSNPF